MISHTIALARQVIAAGGVIAYPTEAVWGLGCDPYNEIAVKRILALKKRPQAKGLIIVVADLDQLQGCVGELSAAFCQRIDAAKGVPTTWLIPDPKRRVPAWVKGSHSSVAIRVSQHAPVVELCRRWGGPIISTSANPAGLVEARSLLKVNQYFHGQLDYCLAGSLGKAARPSEIRDLSTNRVLRSA